MTPTEDEDAPRPSDAAGSPPAEALSAEPDSAPESEAPHGSVLDPYLRTANRIARAVRGLLAAHVIVVRSEAQRELFRYLTGFVLLGGAVAFFFSTALLSSVTLVAGIQRATGLPLLESLLICLGVTFSLATLLALLAFLRLRRAPMPQSRELIRQTLRGLDPRD